MRPLIIIGVYTVGLFIFLWLNNKAIDKDNDNQFMRDFTVGLLSILWPISWWINLAC